MAKNTAKEPGQFRQIFMVLRRTIELDPKSVWFIFIPVAAVLGLGATFTAINFIDGGILMGILLIILTLLSSFVTFSFTLSRRAEKAAYASWEGQAGAVSAVVQTLLRSRWRGAEQPVAVNPRSYDAVYRIVGAPGIVLIGEGHQNGAQVLIETERKKLQRIAPGVPIHTLYVTDSAHSLKLAGLRKATLKLPKKLNRSEIKTVASRLSALGNHLPIPKGIDPRRARPVRK